MERDSPWEALSQVCRKLLTEEKLQKLASWFQDYYPSFEPVALSKLDEFLSADQVDKVRSHLRAHTSQESMPHKVTLPELPSRTRLYAQILEKVCEQDIDETEKSGLIQKLQEGANDYTEERLIEDLSEFVGKKKIEQVKKELAAVSFWDQQPEANKVSQLLSYKQDQLQLKNYIEDFKRIPELGEPPHRWPLQKHLMKCLIDAFLSAFPSLRSSDQEFIKTLNPQQFIEEIQKLVTVVAYEGRMTKKIKKCVDQLLQTGNQPKKTSSYDLLLTIRRELVPVDVADLCRLVEKTNQAKGEIDGKDIILFIGDTGSGKTTTIKALLGYKMGFQRHKGMKFVTIVEPILDQKVSIMESNPECKSVSRYVVAVRPKVGMAEREIYLTDTPGIGDTGGIEVQISNGLAITTALRHCRSVVPVIVISQESWGLRGEGFRNLARSLANLFHSYDNCKESVVVLLNRFTSEDMKELPNKLENLLETTHSADVIDRNYIGMLEHFLLMSHSGQLYNIDILNNSESKKFLNEILLAKQPLLDPMNLFNHEQNCGVKQYCSEIQKRIEYHLQKENLSAVEYFLNEINQFYLATRNHLLGELSEKLKNQFDSVIQKKYSDFVGQFNSRAFSGVLQEGDCELYHQFMHNMEDSNSHKSLKSVNWVEEATNNLKFVVENMTSLLTKGDAEDNDKIQKLLANLRLLVKIAHKYEEGCFAEIYQTTKKSFMERASSFKEDYTEDILQGDMYSAIKAYEAASRNISYGLTLADQDKNELEALKAELERSLADYVVRIVGQGHEIVGSEIPNMEELVGIDTTLRKIGNSHSLIDRQQQIHQRSIQAQFFRFNGCIREFVLGTATSLLTIVSKGKTVPIDQHIANQYRRQLEVSAKAKKLVSIEDYADGQYHRVRTCMEEFIESKCEVLSEVVEDISNSPFKADKPVEIAASIVGLSYFIEFTNNGETVQAVKTLITRVIDSLKKFEEEIVRLHRDSASGISFENTRNFEIFEGFENVYALEKILSILAANGISTDTNMLSHLVQGMEWTIIEKLRSSPSLIEEAIKKEEPQYFTFVDRILQFVDLTVARFPSERINGYAETTYKAFKPIMCKVSESLLVKIRGFSQQYFGKTTISQRLAVLRSEGSEEIQEGQELKEIREDYSRAWSEFQLAADKIAYISEDCLFLAAALTAKDPMILVVERQLSMLKTLLSEEQSIVQSDTSDEKRIELLCTITCPFAAFFNLHKTESKAFSELSRYSAYFMQKFSGLTKNIIKELNMLLASKDFSAVNKLFEKHQGDSNTDNQLTNTIKKYRKQYKKEKKQKMNGLLQSEGTLNVAKQCAQEIKEMHKFVEMCFGRQSRSLAKYEAALRQHIEKVKERISKNIGRALKKTGLIQACKLNEELANIESIFPNNQNKQETGFTHELVRRIDEERIKLESKQLQLNDYKSFFQFFKKVDEIQHPIEQLRRLIELWEQVITTKVQTDLQNYRKSRNQANMKTIKARLDELVEFLPTENLRNTYRRQITQTKESLKEKNKKVQEQAEKELENFPVSGAEKLIFERVKATFYKLNESKNKQLFRNFENRLEDACKNRRQFYRSDGRSLKDYNRFLLYEIFPFLNEFRRNKNLQSTIQDLYDSFESFYRTRLDNFQDQVAKEVASKKEFLKKGNDAGKGYTHLMELMQDIYGVVVESLDQSQLKNLKFDLLKVYEESIEKIIILYEDLSSVITVGRLFDGSDYNEPLAELYSIHDLEWCIDRIGAQMASIENCFSGQFWKRNSHYSLKQIKTVPKDNQSEVEVIEQVTNKFRRVSKYHEICRRMKETTTFVSKFDINDRTYTNVDEVTFAQALKQFKNGLFSCERYNEAYQLFAGQSFTSLRHCEMQLKSDIKKLGEQTLQRLTLADSICDSSMEGLNDPILKLTTYKKVYQDEDCIINKIYDRLDQIILEGEKLGRQRIEQGLKVFTDNEKKVKQLRGAMANELGSIDKGINEKYGRKLKETSKQPDSIEREKTEEKLKYDKEIQLKYNPLLEQTERQTINSFNDIARTLIFFKMMEMTLKVSYDRCKSILEGFIKTIQKNGRQYGNLLAKALDETGDSYAMQILRECKVFDSYSIRLFKCQLKNNGIEYVVQNLKYEGKEGDCKSAKLAFEKEKQEILIKYQQYKQVYTNFTENYRLQPTQNSLNSLKNSIRSKALEVKNQYEHGISTCGHELLALIFALWTISKANNTEDGVEYLYDPHPAQVATIFMTLGLTSNGKLGNRLAEVLTGEGKSIVVAGTACYLALIGYEVNCVCYSILLSKRDYDDFKPLFQQLAIEEYIIYSTFGETSQRLINSRKFDLRDKVESIILNRSPFRGVRVPIAEKKKIMLVDEVDVFFSKTYFGELYEALITLKSETINKLADYVWFHENNNINFKKLTKGKHFVNCINQFPQIVPLLKYEAVKMLEGIRLYRQEDYIVHNGKLLYVEPEGLTEVDSWALTFAYYHEVEQGTVSVRPQDYASLIIECGNLSYAELPTHYDHIIGVSGTLCMLPKCQKNILFNWYGISGLYIIPSVYGECRRENRGAKLVQGRRHFSEITSAIENANKKQQPVLVFFENFDYMNEFYASSEFTPFFKQAQILSERNDDHEIKNRVNLATRNNQVTLLTKAFGRGIDFIVVEKSVKDAGGVHVIQTFVSLEESESLQIEGRTARQGEKGTFQLILKYQDLRQIGLNPRSIEQTDPVKIYELMRQHQRLSFSENYQAQITKAENCKVDHRKAMRILEMVERGDKMGVRSAIDELNKVDVPKIKKYRKYHRR